MTNSARRIVPVLVLTILAGSGLSACKEGTDLTGPTLVATPDFEATARTATDHYITVREAGVNGSRISLEIVVGEVEEPVSAIALKVRYPNAFARFVTCSDGDLFPVEGKCYKAETAPGSGEVFLARTIQAPQQPVAVDGEKVILKLEFLVFGVGEGDIVFESQNLGGGDASALLDAQGDPIFMSWYSGKLVGR